MNETIKKKRLFFALIINNELLSALSTLAHQLKRLPKSDNVRWLPSEKFHITLRFLGETANEKIPDVISTASKVFEKFPAFKIQPGKLLLLPLRHPRVIGVNVKLKEDLAQLYNALNQAMAGLGFKQRRGVFLPHITIGRLRDIKAPNIDKTSFSLPKKVPVNEVILFESETNESGSVYSVLEKFYLQ